MENYQGDLADIIRAGGGTLSGTLGGTTTSSSGDLPTTVDNSWQFNQSSDPMIYHSDDFGHPFSSLRDPLLLEELDSSFFTSSNSIDQDSSGFCGVSSNIFVGDNNNNNIEDQQEEDQIKRAAACNNNNSNNIFSRILQISPNNNVKLPIPPCESPVTVPRVVPKPPPPSNSTLICNDHHMIESTGVQISSPRNTGIKRRKSQAKKVVCIPAPAPANSRPTGEIVPSDLWAWRKYGQKPIKGSPYPRGYYRCSSSKGCSARKQVERSQTDPNMLVITYTSEHNHPWPTQRNALAGSTRTQPTKNINTKNSPGLQSQKAPLLSLKEEQQQKDNTNNIIDNVLTTSIDVKEEEMDDEKEITEMENGEQLGFSNHDDQSYRPELPNSINHPDQDFFADLGEIEADPLNLLFTQRFSGYDREERENNKAASLDPFSFYDWTGNSNNNITSFGDQAKEGFITRPLKGLENSPYLKD